MGSIPGQRTKIPHGAGRGFLKKKKKKKNKPWSSLSSLDDFRSMCLSHGRLFNKYLSSIKDMSFFLIPLSKELFINTSISSKISNPWVTLAVQSDNSYRTTRCQRTLDGLLWGGNPQGNTGVYEESRRQNSGSSLAFCHLIVLDDRKDSFSLKLI